MNQNNKEDILSNYIDRLNQERKPKEHEGKIESEELEELFETVRMVRSLKEPVMPSDDYSKELISIMKRQLNPRRKWYYGAGIIAAAVVFIILMNIVAPFNKANLVSAMEEAYKEVKAYHGVLEIVETNGEGNSVTQAKIEVWADKEGRYYTKGLAGAQKDLITVNDGQKKWQIQVNEKEVDIFPAFPDHYSFTFEIGKEIELAKNAVKTKVIGEEDIAGRTAIVMEVTLQGGSAYKLWIDQETKMPLQKQSAMEYALQYKVRYATIDFIDRIPGELLTYSVPAGFKEVNKNMDLVVETLEAAAKLAGFSPKVITNLPAAYEESGIAVVHSSKAVKINYASKDNKVKISTLQRKATGEFKPASTAILGKINNHVAEIQAPIQADTGVFQEIGAYAGLTGFNSVRWQENGMEYVVLGNTSLEELTPFIKAFTDGSVELFPANKQAEEKPQVTVPVDMEAEAGDQKNVDAGHSPWKLDPVFVAQVFVSMKMSPQGVVGEYPVKYEELKVVKNTGIEAVVEVTSTKSPIKKVYLKKLIRQDPTGIWTVVGYDPKE